MRQRLTFPLALDMAIAANAETIVLWERAETEKIKVKAVDGQVVGTWSFPKRSKGVEERLPDPVGRRPA